MRLMRPIIAIIGTSRDGYTLANTHHFRKVLEAGGLPVLFSLREIPRTL
ncbi:hypothetical protein [Thermococcus sp. JCM 11816]